MPISILTEPPGSNYNNNEKYGGHKAVTRSLLEGFAKIGFTDYNYNPSSIEDMAEQVHVLSGVHTLMWAIGQKRLGRIKKLTAGPNVVVFSSDYDGLITSAEIDMYLQPSQWGVEVHNDRNDKIIGRCRQWAAGVDLNNFIMNQSKCHNKKVLIYQKSQSSPILANKAEFLLRNRGYDTVIFRYGSYKFEEYIRTLSEVSFMVTIGGSESQGLYMAEAWAMDVPTLCLSSDTIIWDADDGIYKYCSNGRINVNAPYLCEMTGAEWRNPHELMGLVENIDSILEKTSPRRWVFDNMSDEVCARKFLEMVGVDY